MLILVGVTVNVALQGGLFGKAENATTGTTKHADKEQLISAMVGGVQTGGKFVMTDVTLPDGAKWITSKENVAAITSPSENGNWVMTESGNKFYIDKYGNVLDDEPISKITFESNKALGKITLNPTLKKVNDFTKYGTPDKDNPDEIYYSRLVLYDDNESELNVSLIPINDNSTYCILVTNFNDGFNPEGEYILYGVYIYAFESIDTTIDDIPVKTNGAGWYTVDKNNNVIKLPAFPTFDGYSTHNIETDKSVFNAFYGDVFIQE